MQPPFFSLIIPVYKTERFLEECFTSLLEQTFRDFEAIIIDDGSPGEAGYPTVEESFKKILGSDNRFKYIRQKNLGVSAARNTAINVSNGIFLKFVDSDDILKKTHLQNLHDSLIKYERKWDSAIFYLKQIRSFISDENGNKTFVEPHCSHKKDTFLKELIYFGISGPKLIVLRKLAGDTRFKEGLKAHEESDFYLRVFLNNRFNGYNLKFIELNDDSYLYRLHQNSFTKQLEPIFNLTAVNIYQNFLKQYESVLSSREKILCRLGVLRFRRDERKSLYQKYTKKFFGLIAKIIGGWYTNN